MVEVKESRYKIIPRQPPSYTVPTPPSDHRQSELRNQREYDSSVVNTTMAAGSTLSVSFNSTKLSKYKTGVIYNFFIFSDVSTIRVRFQHGGINDEFDMPTLVVMGFTNGVRNGILGVTQTRYDAATSSYCLDMTPPNGFKYDGDVKIILTNYGGADATVIYGYQRECMTPGMLDAMYNVGDLV